MTAGELAIWRKYQEAKIFFDRAVDAKHAALCEAAEWRRIAERRYRVPTTYVMVLAALVLGFILGAISSVKHGT